MTRLRNYTFLVLSLLFFLGGCTIYPKRTSTPSVVDPLIERNRQWREHVDVGNYELKRGNLRAALTAYEAAVTIRSDSNDVQYKIAEIYLQLEEYENARDAFLIFLTLDPNNITALNYVGYISEKLSNYAAAAEYYERVLDISADNLYALNHLGLAYKQLQRYDDGIRVLHKALSIDPRCERPECENLHNYLGLIYLEQGKVGEAIAEFRASIRLFPNDIWARQQLAALYENQQRYFEAQLQYQQLLEVAPDNLLAITRLQALSQLNLNPVQVVDVPPVTLLDPDVESIIANAPDASDYPDADTLVLFNHFSHDVLPTGQSRYTTHQVVKILTERGIQRYGDIAIPYQPASQNIGVNIARTITADGTVLQPPDEAYNDVTPPGLLAYNLYSDALWKVISMVGLAPGVCIEYKVTLEDKVAGGETWITGGYNFQSTEATLETSYALQMPKAWRLQWEIANPASQMPPLVPQVSYTADDTVIYIWKYGATPAVASEDGMPHINDIVPRLHYSSIADWGDVYTWYKELAKGRYTPDAAIEAKVRHLTRDLRTDAAKIRAIYNFVASKIRYVGIELGQSAYQPSYATEVFQMQYGDCKDKTTLLISMLDLAGIKAYPCLISMAPHERIDTTLPFLSQFNHMIAAVPTGTDTYIWLDTTAATCSYGDLPYSTQGRTGFLISDTHGLFVETPVFPPASNRLVSTTELTLNGEGTAAGTIRIQTRGQYSLNTRWTYQQIHPNAMKTTLATELSQQFPGIQIEWCDVSDLSDLNVPVEINLGFHVENYAESLGSNILLRLPIDEFAAYAETFADAQRTHSLDFGYPMQIEKTVHIRMPEGWTAVLPEDLHHTIEIAELSRQYRQVENVITYRLVFILKNRILPAAAYPAAKSLFVSLASEDGSYLLLNSGQQSAISSQQEQGLGDRKAGRVSTQSSAVPSKF